MKLMKLQNRNYYDLNFIMNSRNMDKNVKFKIFTVMKVSSKLYLVNCFYASLLMIGYKDLVLIFYI